MELRVNDYVRTKYGEICKLKKSRFKDLVYETDIEIDRCNDRDCNDYGFDSNTIQDIIKSSPKIIDLIEAGDYVNGEQVYESRYHELYISYVYCGGIGVRTTECYATFINDMKEEDIESIVTKEQFESMEYKEKEI